MKTRQASEYAILGALKDGSKHGYEILKFLETRLGSTWYVSTSQLYVLLKRLESRDWIKSSVEIQETRPPKKIFSLTVKGNRAFEQWLFSPTIHVRDLRIEFLSKLFFIKELRMKDGEKLVESQTALLESLKDSLGKRRKDKKEGFQRLVLDARIANIASWIDWMKRSAATFLSKG